MTRALIAKAGHFPDADDDFNHDAAEAVFTTIMKMDYDEATVFAGMLHGAINQRDLACHASAISKALNSYYSARAVEIGKQLVRGAVSKARDGRSPDAEVAALEIISKAESHETYAETARKRKRDLLTGRFVTDHVNIPHNPGPPLHREHATLLGIPEPILEGIHFTGEQRAQFQQGYREVVRMLAPYSELPAKDAVLHLHYSDSTQTLSTPVKRGRDLVPQVATATKKGRTVDVNGPGLDPTKQLVGASLSVVPNLDTTAGAYQAAFAAVGVPEAGRFAGSALGDGGLGDADTWDPDKQGSFGDHWTRHADGDEFAPSRKAFRRLSAGSQALEATLGNAAPPQLKIALKIGQHVGDLGPEAQKVIGPTADRTAYRYRGIERAPDKRLLNAVANVMRPARVSAKGDGRVIPGSGLTGQQKHDLLFNGSEDDQGNWRASAPMAYLRSRLPETKLNTLQRMSGVIPPSEGFILDKTGKVTTQAVGYGDDHYLPFNLKRLRGLRGGEYIRTRTWGGPTTEDIYTGLVGGARSLAVVSHNGVYTLEFDDDLKGGRRFNDKAARMVARYGQLLDAVKSEQVTTGGLDPSRLRELEANASDRYDQDVEPERYDQYLAQLKTAEKRNPRLSNQQEGQAGVDFFTDLAARRSEEMTAPDLVNDYVNQRAATEYAGDSKLRADMIANGMSASGAPSLEENRARIRASLEDANPVTANRNLADALGVRRQYDTAIKRATEDNKAALKPLALDAQGYELALTALQEQFPYYIKSTRFHPWTQGGTNGRDTGYVMPKHNRPSQVLAGYFDPDITGKGKAFAHTIRNQNRHQIRRVPTSAERQTQMRERIAGRGVGAPGAVISGPPDKAVGEALSKDATWQMIEHLKNQPSFSMSAGSTPEQRAALAGQPVGPDLVAMLSSLGSLHKILATTTGELRRELDANPVEVRRRTTEALGQVKAHNLFHLDAGLQRRFESGGLVEGPRQLSANPAEDLLGHSDQDYDFDNIGPEYAEDRSPSAQHVLDRVGQDPRVRQLHAFGLPSTPADGQAWDAALATLTASNAQAYRDAMTYQAGYATGRTGGHNPPKRSLAEVNEQAEGILRAKQLGRRYHEAVRRETASSITPASMGPQVTIIQSDDPEDLMRRALGG